MSINDLPSYDSFPCTKVHSSARHNIRNILNRNGIETNRVKVRHKTGRVYSIDTFTIDDLKKVKKLVSRDFTKELISKAIGIMTDTYKANHGISLSQQSINIGHCDSYFSNMKSNYPSWFRLLRIIGKGRVDIGYKNMTKYIDSLVDDIATLMLNYKNRHQVCIVLSNMADYSTEFSAQTVVYAIDEGIYNYYNSFSYKKLKKIKKALEDDIEAKRMSVKE